MFVDKHCKPITFQRSTCLQRHQLVGFLHSDLFHFVMLCFALERDSIQVFFVCSMTMISWAASIQNGKVCLNTTDNGFHNHKPFKFYILPDKTLSFIHVLQTKCPPLQYNGHSSSAFVFFAPVSFYLIHRYTFLKFLTKQYHT